MSAPEFENRRRKELFEDLLERGEVWLPEWQPQRAAPDFARALFGIAARLSAEVTQRLSRVPEKTFRGFVDWLGVRGDAARAARVPVVFVTTPVSEPVPADAGVQIQASEVYPPVTLETENPLRIIPGTLASLVAADPGSDRFSLPPPGLLALEPPPAQPDEWIVRSAGDSGKAQLDPPIGLAAGVLVADANGIQHQVTAFESGIATLNPSLAVVSAAPSADGSADAANQAANQPRVTRVTTFDAFDPLEYKRQEHALYIGGEEGLDVKTAAVIEVQSEGLLPGDLTWSYWGKATSSAADPPHWERIATYWLGSRLLLLKPAGAPDKKEISGQNRFWLRAQRIGGFTQGTRLSRIRLLINCDVDLDAIAESPNQAHRDFAAAKKSAIANKTAMPECEGVANTAPLVLNTPFYPLGREPRQFDSFYLGCKEAFSKPEAKVTLDFAINDQFSNALIAVQLPAADTYLLFGIGNDGKLRRLSIKDAFVAADARLDFLASTQPPESNGSPVSLETGFRPGAALSGDSAKVLAVESVSDSEKRVWLYSGSFKEEAGDWKLFGKLQQRQPEAGKKWAPWAPQTLVVQGTTILRGYVVHGARRYMTDDREDDGVRGGRLYQGELAAPAAPDVDWGGEPLAIPSKEGEKEVIAADIATVAAFIDPKNGPGTFNDSDGLVAVSSPGALFFREGAHDGLWKAVDLSADAKPIDCMAYPLAIKMPDGNLVVVAKIGGAASKKWEIVAIPIPIPFQGKPGNIVGLTAAQIGGVFKGTAFGLTAAAVNKAGPFKLHFFVGSENSLKLARAELGWDTEKKVPRLEPATLPAPVPEAVRAETSFAPVAVGSTVLLPGEKGGVYIEKFTVPPPITVKVPAQAGVVLDLPSQELGSRQFVDLTPENPDAQTLVEVNKFVEFPKSVELPKSQSLLLLKGPAGQWKSAEPYSGDIKADLFDGKRVLPAESSKIQLDPDDTTTRKGDVLYLAQGATRKWIRTVKEIRDPQPAGSNSSSPREAELDRALMNALVTTNLKYKSVKKLRKATNSLPQLLPVLDASDPALDDVDDADLLKGTFSVAKALPATPPQRARLVVEVTDQTLVVLDKPWGQAPPSGNVDLTFTSDAVEASWTATNPPTPNNPTLSWEYWDGSSWWQIAKVDDETANLVKSGKVIFRVPRDLKPTDVVGRTNHWIRARLLGGDYGREVVKLVTSPATPSPPNSTTQMVERITDGIRAPYVVSLEVGYSVCSPITPEAVIAEDNGGLLDQSDANRTPGAAVEAFVPLGEALSRLAGPGSAAASATAKAPAPFECHDCATGAGWRPSSAVDQAAAGPAGDSGGKAIYLGFDAALSGGPITLLFLVAERKHDEAFPLRVDVLRRSGFEPVTAQDGTRGLNESGIVSFTLSEPPSRANLFGSSLFWMRLRPRSGFSGDWLPVIRGAWLNASWAIAAETQSVEVLGSSDGSPNQSVFLARHPVIKDSLDLRLRERIDEEEIAELSRAEPESVLVEIGGRKGPWVRWREVAETDAEPAGARVYTLDDGTGEITFGDGLHGRIPPAGRDAILARRYRRGGGDAANRIRAFSQVNLITPLQGVSGVLVPDGAAGGSDPQDAAAILRNAPSDIFSRDRVLTLADIEMRALDFSPDVAQARATSTRAGVELVVVMRGLDAAPPQKVQRELIRYLARRAPPAWNVRGALAIVPPLPVPIRVELEVAIDEIAFSGAVAAAAETRVAGLFDPARGGALFDPARGIDGSGWPLGALPTEADVARVLVDIPHLEELRSVRFYRIADPGSVSVALPALFSPREMIVLSPGDVRSRFSLVDSELIR